LILWSGLSESNRHLNLGKVDTTIQKRWKWRLLAILTGPQMENKWKMGNAKSLGA